VEDVLAQRAIVRAFLITHLIGVAISVLGTLSGVMAAGWPVVGVYFVLASGHASFQLTGPNPAGRGQRRQRGAARLRRHQVRLLVGLASART
jgi:hypothetical protein